MQNKLLKSYSKPKYGDPAELFPQDQYISDLTALRNKYALRLHKGLAEFIIKHKHARAIYLYLELKPLFSSGVIFADYDRIPYKKIAEFTGEGISTIRRKITILKKMKLIKIDHKKNICLASIKKLPIAIKATKDPQHYKKKYFLLNNGDTQFTIKNVAIYENLKRQEHRLFIKIYQKELQEILYQRDRLDNINSNGAKPKQLSKCEQYFTKGQLKRIRKSVRNNFDQLKRKYQNIYDRQIQQLNFGFPEINPNITLSCKGLGNVLGVSPSSAHYQLKQLANRGLIYYEGNYSLITDKSPAIFESICGIRSDVFSYVYPTRKTISGKIRKYFINKPNTLKPLENTLFF